MAGSFPFLAPYLHTRFGLAYETVGLVLAAFGVGAFAYTRWVKQMVGRLGETGMVMLGGWLIAVALGIGMASDDWPIFFLVQLALGAGYLMLHGVLQARATELMPDARSTAVAGFVFMLFLGQALGALGMGYLIGRFGYQTAFWIDAASVGGLTVWITGLMRRPPVQVVAAQ